MASSPAGTKEPFCRPSGTDTVFHRNPALKCGAIFRSPVFLDALQEPAGGYYRKGGDRYLTCPETSLVISNIVTVFLPLKTTFSAASALMLVLFFSSWSLFFLM